VRRLGGPAVAAPTLGPRYYADSAQRRVGPSTSMLAAATSPTSVCSSSSDRPRALPTARQSKRLLLPACAAGPVAPCPLSSERPARLRRLWRPRSLDRFTSRPRAGASVMPTSRASRSRSSLRCSPSIRREYLTRRSKDRSLIARRQIDNRRLACIRLENNILNRGWNSGRES
jgi:hypothetical protein